MIFKALFRPRREVQREYAFSPYFAKNIRFEAHVECAPCKRAASRRISFTSSSHCSCCCCSRYELFRPNFSSPPAVGARAALERLDQELESQIAKPARTP